MFSTDWPKSFGFTMNLKRFTGPSAFSKIFSSCAVPALSGKHPDNVRETAYSSDVLRCFVFGACDVLFCDLLRLLQVLFILLELRALGSSALLRLDRKRAQPIRRANSTTVLSPWRTPLT